MKKIFRPDNNVGPYCIIFYYEDGDNKMATFSREDVRDRVYFDLHTEIEEWQPSS